MPVILPLIAAGSLALGPAILVDFKLQPVTAPPKASTANVEATASAPDPLPPNVTAPDAGQMRPHAHFFIANGFGRDVPLAFAVRQVVPPRVHVSFDDSVDKQARVSWDGGKPWNEVLQAAVKPLGLHLIVTRMAVKITG